jgi:hypothetical protein
MVFEATRDRHGQLRRATESFSDCAYPPTHVQPVIDRHIVRDNRVFDRSHEILRQLHRNHEQRK